MTTSYSAFMQAWDENGHPGAMLERELERLREDHVKLKATLFHLYGTAKEIGHDAFVTDWSGRLKELRNRVQCFMVQLDDHSMWEQHLLFPILQLHTGKQLDPIAVMEQEHAIAEQYIERFFELVSQAPVPLDGQKAREIASCLLQANVILTEHFHKEEELVFSMVEKVITDIEQFYS